MDGVRWSTTRSRESFSRSATTLSRLASFIARADPKPHTSTQIQQPDLLPTYVCGECGKGFSYPADLLQHQEVKHTLPKPHRCPSCGEEFSLRSSLQLHRCRRDSTRCERCQGLLLLGAPCSACRTRTADPGRLQDKSHLRQPHLLDGSPYACAPCGRGFSQKQALLHHQQAGCSQSPSNIVHRSCLADDSPPVSEGDSSRSDSSDSPGPSSRASSMCQFCSRTFRTEAALQRHQQNNHVEEQQKAKDQSPDGETRTERRSKLKHKAGQRLASKKLLTCRSCDMVFRSTSKLYVHRREKHSREKNVQSEVRPVIIKRRKTGTYPCQLCSKVFFHHLSLRAHFRRHAAPGFTTGCTAEDSRSTGDGLHKEKTSQVENKTVGAGPGRPRREPGGVGDADPGRCREAPDVKEEEEEREFPCPSCAEVFSLQWQLKEHMELHQSSVRRRQCSVCTNEMDTCKWPSSKRQRLYHCVPCQQGFSALDAFLQHCQQHLRVKVEEDRMSEGSTQQAGKA